MVENTHPIQSMKHLAQSRSKFRYVLGSKAITTLGYHNEWPTDPDVAKYVLNEDGFRSEPFKLLNPENVNILYGGCSWTFGDGVLLENSWPARLSELLKEKVKTQVEYFNVSVLGGSPQLVIRNIMGFINKYGKPDYLFINLPGSNRAMVLNQKTETFFNAVLMIEELTQDLDKKDFKRYVNNYEPRESLLSISTMMSLLESFCESSNIKLLWTTYDPLIERSVIDMDLKSFVKDSHKFIKKHKTFKSFSNLTEYPNLENIPHWEVAWDKTHPGAAWHYDISNTFIKELSDRKML